MFVWRNGGMITDKGNWVPREINVPLQLAYEKCTHRLLWDQIRASEAICLLVKYTYI
jgi:hypothetical protein